VSEVRGITSKNFLKSALSQSPLKNCAAAVVKMRRVDEYSFGVSRKRFKPSTPGSSILWSSCQPLIVYIIKGLNATFVYFEWKLSNSRYG